MRHWLALVLALSVTALSAAEPLLRPGDRVAVIGDSITEQKQYSRHVAVYLLASSGVAGLDVAQFGWSGERAPGFVGRAQRSLEWFRPTVATTCYGMNDGTYTAYTEAIGGAYREGMRKVAAELRTAGVRDLVLGSPGVVDVDTWRTPQQADMYNDNLARLGAIAAEVAGQAGARHADVHGPMLAAMTAAKAAYGKAYHVAGKDGVHPDGNGHLVMAQAFLEALGCDGAIGRIELGAAGATASAGHRVVSSGRDAAELESSRWPFILAGDGKSPGSTRSIAPYCGFIERLDRLVVAMPGCTWAKARITWGSATAEVDGAALREGVNLMAVFTATPFDQAARGLDKAVWRLQEAETAFVKGLINLPGRSAVEADPASKALFAQLIERQIARRAELAAEVRALLVPVRHRIAVAEAR